ncbi:hypothetical protein K8I85_13930 [bacterium]|nr:hypothetical protein [bacterium]
MEVLTMAARMAKWAAALGLVCGVLYSVGGFFRDLFTTGLNAGTAMAFGALVGMPVLFGAAGLLAGATVGLVAAGVRAVRGR